MAHEVGSRTYFRLTKGDLKRFRIDENSSNEDVSLKFTINGRNFVVPWRDLWNGVGTFKGLRMSKSWESRGEHTSTKIPDWILEFEQ